MNAKEFQARLNDWTPEGEGRHSGSFTLDGWTVALTADDTSRFAGLVWDLTMTRQSELPAGRTLKQWGEAITASASGLMEDLKLLEVDTGRNVALLRSDKPTRIGNEASYYEILLDGLAKATVRRYRADVKAGTPRHQVAFAITHESLAKLAADIAA